MLQRLKAVSGWISAGELRRLTAIVRLAAVGKQLPMGEWTLFDRMLSEYEAEVSAEKKENAGGSDQQEKSRDEAEESAVLYVREMLRTQNKPHSGQRRGR
ncbi:MAG: hypothetical protein Q4E13_05585 [Clostridia bacterium]|nr:hypothetical protein [Clostridia bacterium]